MKICLVIGRPVPEIKTWNWPILDKVEVHYFPTPKDTHTSLKEMEEEKRSRRFFSSPLFIDPGTGEGDYFTQGNNPGITRIRIPTPIHLSEVNIIIDHKKKEWRIEALGDSSWVLHIIKAHFVYLWFRDEKTSKTKEKNANGKNRSKRRPAHKNAVYPDA